MTEEVAIKILDGIATRNMFCTLEQEQLEAFRIAIEAIEKQVAKKPLRGADVDGNEYRICNQCCAIVKYGDAIAHYCPDCGQKVDWSEEEKNV